MSPLSLYPRYLSSEALVYTTLPPTEPLTKGSRRSEIELTTAVVVIVTTTQRFTLPRPTSSITSFPLDVGCDAVPPTSAGSPIEGCAMSETYTSPTSTPMNGAASNAGFKTGLAAGAVIGVLSIIIAAVLYVFYRSSPVGYLIATTPATKIQR